MKKEIRHDVIFILLSALEEDNISFKDYVSKARALSGLSQKRLSEITGISERTLQNWEGGQRTPPRWNQIAAAKFIFEKITEGK